MTFLEIITKFRFKPKQKPEEEIKKDLEIKKEEVIRIATRAKHLLSSNTGWKEVSVAIEKYIDACYMHKLKTGLDTATPEILEELKYIDRDIYILKWVLQIPQQFINKAEAQQKKENENETH